MPIEACNVRSVQGVIRYRGVMPRDSISKHIGDIGVKIYGPSSELLRVENNNSNYSFVDPGGFTAWFGKRSEMAPILDEISDTLLLGKEAHVGHRHPIYPGNNNQGLNLMVFGPADYSMFFDSGEYRYEVYYNDNLLFSKKFYLY